MQGEEGHGEPPLAAISPSHGPAVELFVPGRDTIPVVAASHPHRLR